jgi:hypothetical protein
MGRWYKKGLRTLVLDETPERRKPEDVRKDIIIIIIIVIINFTGEITLHVAQIVNTQHRCDNKDDEDDNDDDDDDDNNNNNNNNIFQIFP